MCENIYLFKSFLSGFGGFVIVSKLTTAFFISFKNTVHFILLHNLHM